MNNQSENIYKSKKALKGLELEAEQLLKEIEAETDTDKSIELVREYNNLQGRLDAAFRIVNPDKKIKPIHISVQKAPGRQSKRCG